MNLLSKLSNKVKILILVVYSLIAVLIAFLIASAGTKSDLMKGYTHNAFDDYVKASYRVQEVRQSSRQANEDFENSSYRVYAYIEKRTPSENTKIAIDDIMLYIAGENKEGKLLFDEPSSTTKKSISTTGTVASYGSNAIPNNIFVKKVTKESDKDILLDNTPVKLYFTLKYTAVVTKDGQTTNTPQVLKYTIDLTNVEKQDFTNFEERSIYNKRVENLHNEPFDLEISKTKTDSSSNPSIIRDRFSIKIYLNSPNLSINKLMDFKIEVFGEVKNDSTDNNNQFVDYVRVYTYSGGVISSSYSTITAELDEQYETNKFYAIVHYEYEDGTKQDLKFKFVI